MVGVNYVGDGHVAELVLRVAEELFTGGVDGEEVALEIVDVDDVESAFEYFAVRASGLNELPAAGLKLAVEVEGMEGIAEVGGDFGEQCLFFGVRGQTGCEGDRGRRRCAGRAGGGR